MRDITNQDISNYLSNLGNGKVVIAACKPDQYAYELSSHNHGIFTFYLIQGLFGDAADSEGHLTVTNLYSYIARNFEKRTNQTPVYRGDIVGSLVLGTGLTPRDVKTPPDETLNQITAQAERLMNQYIQLASTNMETWRNERYRQACSSLSVTIDWFEKQRNKYPSLMIKMQFQNAYSTAKGKLADLARLENGLQTRDGKVETKIGSGTFGSVWKLKSDGKELAYKVYHPIDLDNNDKLSRFNRGYRAMELLDHPHIVKVHKLTSCPVGFIMDYIPGTNLRDYAPIASNPLEIISQLLTVGETLKHTHSRDIIHRDVKPENIIMKYESELELYRPYLTDFDLSWFSTATQFTNEGLGSLIYAAPEQLAKPNSNAAHSKTTDVYAFGQLLFFFICQRDPVPKFADNEYALAEALKNNIFEKPAMFLVDLYRECTKENPSARIQDFREISDRLFEIHALVSESDHEKRMSFEEFARQLIFSVIGLSPERSLNVNSFLSISGRTKIELSKSNENLILRFEAQTPLTVEGANDYREARAKLNQRIDNALIDFKNIRRKAGKQTIYESFITINKLPLNMDGIESARQILMRVLDSIERA